MTPLLASIATPVGTMQMILTGGLAAIGAIVTIWLIKVAFPAILADSKEQRGELARMHVEERERSEVRHLAEIQRVMSYAETQRIDFGAALDRVVESHTRSTERLVGKLDETKVELKTVLEDVATRLDRA